MENDFDKMVRRLAQARMKLPDQIAVLAVEFSKERFRGQNWLDDKIKMWQPRKIRRSGGIERSQTLLVNTGRLKRSIRKISATQDLVVVGTDVPYASIHNNGGKINTTANVPAFSRRAHSRVRQGRREDVSAHIVKAHTRKMDVTVVKRQFIGQSKELDRRVVNLIAAKLEAALRG